MLKLYKSKSLGDIHYLITYNGNIIGMKGKTDPESKKLVVFKNAKKPTATIANAMREAIKQIDPNADICVIPSHTPKLNNLQIALNNQSIVKKYETTPRKTNHHKPIDSDYIKSIEINHVKTSNALILIDDVITTGKSIECYLNLMSKYGYEKINILVYGITNTFKDKHDKHKEVSMIDKLSDIQVNEVKPKAKMGRPKKLVNDKALIKQAYMFGYFRATHETMAEFLECHVDTVRDAMRNNQEFSEAYKKGFGTMKMKLSEAQVKTAIEDRNPTLLVWLGKQYLGQKDTPDVAPDGDMAIELRPAKLADSDE